jgi:hypothetical protein
MSAPQSTVRDDRRSVILNVMLIVCGWLTVCGIAAFEFGLWPRTLVGWSIIVGVGPLAWIAAQALGELAIHLVGRLPWIRRSSDWVERRTQHQKFSMLRVAFALLGGVLCWRWFCSYGYHVAIRPTHPEFGFNGIRFSMHEFNTDADIDRAADALRRELAA